MVKIVHISCGFKNITEYLFKEALESSGGASHPDYSGILYLAPALRKVREAQEIFHKLVTLSLSKSHSELVEESPVTDYCYIPPEMVTIGELSKKLYSVYGDTRMIHKSLTPVVLSKISGRGLGFSSLVSDFISELKGNYPYKKTDEIRDSFDKVFNEFNIPESVRELAFDCLEISGKYQEFMANNGLDDDDDIINSCPEYISSVRPHTLILDGIYDPSHGERNIIGNLIRRGAFALIAIPHESQFLGLADGYVDFLKESFDVEEVHLNQKRSGSLNGLQRNYCSYPDPETEVEGIARNIKSLYVSGKLRDLEGVVVAFPDMNKYIAMVDRVFRRYGIPFDVSLKKPLGKTRPFIDMLCLLASVAEDYPRLKFSHFLSSPYFRKIPASLKEWIPVLSIQSGIISGRESWLSLVSEGSETIDIKAIGQAEADIGLEKGLNRVFRILEPLEDMKAATFDTYVNALQKTLDELGFLEVSMIEGQEHSAVVHDEKKVFNEALGNISFLHSLYPEPVTLSEFIEVLRHLLDCCFIKEERPGVKVMPFLEVVGLSPEYLYLGGMVDEAMPGKQKIDYILPDNVKRRLGLLHLDKYINIQRFSFNNIINSSRNIHLSYPLMDGEDMFLPSPFLYPGNETEEKLPGVFSKEEYLIRGSGAPLSSYMSEIDVPEVKKALSVTDIDVYRQCPRRFFIEKILQLSPLSVKEYEMEAITIGSILHVIMERLIFEPFESLDYLKGRAIEIIDEVVRNRRVQGYWKDLIRDTFIEILPDIYDMELEIRKDGYMPMELEKWITGEPVRGIKLRGKIDRIDRAANSVRIIDYKTGTAGLTCSQVLKGNENLQLFLYAAMMKGCGYNVDRVGIYSLKDINIKWCPPKKRVKGQGSRVKGQGSRVKGQGSRVKDENNIDDYITASLKFLEEAVEKMRRGDFSAQPLDEYSCRRCHESPFCPYIQQ